MPTDRDDVEQRQPPEEPTEQPDERGLPGGGAGRREKPGPTGVYPMSASEGASPDAPLEGEMSWGQGERGAKGYYDSGDSELQHMPEESEEGEQDEK